MSSEIQTEMLNQLNSHLDESLSLDSLVSRLETLANINPSFDESEKKKFFNSWLVLEEVNAVTLDEQRTKLNEDEARLVKRSINEIFDLIK